MFVRLPVCPHSLPYRVRRHSHSVVCLTFHQRTTRHSHRRHVHRPVSTNDSATTANVTCKRVRVFFGLSARTVVPLTTPLLSVNHTHTRLTALCPGQPGWASTRKVKPIWILRKQETVSGSGISWAICKSAPRSRQITVPAPHHSVIYRLDALPTAQPPASKH